MHLVPQGNRSGISDQDKDHRKKIVKGIEYYHVVYHPSWFSFESERGQDKC